MSKSGKAAPDAASVVNWDPPTKRELVERAVSDGVRDPKKIADWVETHDVAITVDEVRQLIQEIDAASAPAGKGRRN